LKYSVYEEMHDIQMEALIPTATETEISFDEVQRRKSIARKPQVDAKVGQ
jgi:hypothetical protein